VGYDIDAVHLATARRRAAECSPEMENLLEFRSDDIFALDFSPASVVVMFLVPNMLEPLSKKFKDLPAGTRLMSYHFPLPAAEWSPVQVRHADHPHHPPPQTTKVYAYVVG
jgi:hypothetical protein